MWNLEPTNLLEKTTPYERWVLGGVKAEEIGVSKTWGGKTPQIIHFNRVFPFKPSIFGVPLFLETPKYAINWIFPSQECSPKTEIPSETDVVKTTLATGCQGMSLLLHPFQGLVQPHLLAHFDPF